MNLKYRLRKLEKTINQLRKRLYFYSLPNHWDKQRLLEHQQSIRMIKQLSQKRRIEKEESYKINEKV